MRGAARAIESLSVIPNMTLRDHRVRNPDAAKTQ